MSQPTGNLLFATVTLASQPTAALTVSNGVIVYTGGGSLTLATGSNLQNVQIEGVDLVIPDGASNITINQSTIETIQANGAVSGLTLTRSQVLGDTEFTSLYVAGVGNSIIIEDNVFGPAHEHIHFVNGTGDNCSISYNHLSGSERHGIESQWHGSNNQFNYNLLDNWRKNPGDNNAGPLTDSHIALSIAMGNDGAVAASNNQVVGNVVDFSTGDISVPLPEANWYLTCGIEYMGNNGLVADNYIINNGVMSYCLTDGFASQDNIIIGGNTWAPEAGGGTAPTVSGDQHFAWGAANIPARPTNVGPRYATGYQPGGVTAPNSPTGGSTVTPITVTATNNGDGSVTVSWTPPAGVTIAPAVTIAASQVSYAVPGMVAGQSSVHVKGVPENWVVTATVAYGTQYSGSASAQVTGGPAPTSDTSWSLSVVPPTSPNPTITVTTTTTVTVTPSVTLTVGVSEDGGKTYQAAGTITLSAGTASQV